jgi:uncharacterized protein (DUF433 family)
MIRIRFPDPATEQRALGFLAGRFSFRSWSNGETLVPSAALVSLALGGIPFSTIGPAPYEELAPTTRGASPTDERTIVDQRISHGKPVIRGTRTPLTVILDALAGGDTFETITEDYRITTDDIRACVAFASDEFR